MLTESVIDVGFFTVLFREHKIFDPNKFVLSYLFKIV